MTTTLKNCRLPNQQIADIEITEGTITAIGKTQKEAGQKIDIGGLLVIPGVIDCHVHFREPGGEHKEDWLTGSRAAVSGGVSTVLDMPNNNPPAIDEQTLNDKRARAKKSLVNYGFFLGATRDNLKEIKNAKNIAGVKIFIGSSTGNLLLDKDEDLKELFSVPGVQWVIHAEDEETIKRNMALYEGETEPAVHSRLRSREAAIRAVERLIVLAKKTGARLHICHVSTMEEVELIKQAKEEGLNITCEVSPHHLFLNESAYQKLGNFAKVNPPLRTAADNQALMQALVDGTIDIVATDHAPHTMEEKWQPYAQVPAGLPEVETSLPLLLNEVSKGNLPLERLVEVTAQRPAELFSIKNKGTISTRMDADLTVIDLKKTGAVSKSNLRTKCSWSPYEGWELTGWPIMTFVNGHLVYDNGKINESNKGRKITYGKI